jgi:hypothetical protein
MNLDLGCTRLIIKACKKYGCLRNQAAYILATAYHETAHTMEPVVEAYWLSESWRQRNLRYYPWHGRGFVQLTWEANYIKAQKELGLPFHDDPNTALEPGPAAAVLVKGAMEGWFTGKKISDFVTLQKSDFRLARKVINGMDKADTIAALAKQYDALLKAEGFGEAPEPSIPTAKAKPKTEAKKTKVTPATVAAGGIAIVAAAFWDKIEAFIQGIFS